MKIAITLFASFLLHLTAWADDSIQPKEADAYLAKVGCAFSAYVIYRGKDVGILKPGQVQNTAICVDSYHTRGARSQDFCWLRPIKMREGQYVVDSTGQFVSMGHPCSKHSTLEILRRPGILPQLQFMAANGEWRVATDQFQIGAEFLKSVK